MENSVGLVLDRELEDFSPRSKDGRGGERLVSEKALRTEVPEPQDGCEHRERTDREPTADAAFPGCPGSWIGLADDPAETKRMVRLIDPLVCGGSVHVNHPPSRLATRRDICRYARPCAPPLRVLNRQISRRGSDHAHDDLGHATPVKRMLRHTRRTSASVVVTHT